ncbi:MAG TPA: tetratricopeptide repeat protein [Smithella sp.]|nr:tetratricopeptide repeat protein [Smithella sp.]
MMKRIYLRFFVIFVLVFTWIPFVWAQTQQDILNQYISDLQKNPNDNALREKIIRFAQTMKPAPAVPAEVDELVGQAKYAFKHAKEQKDYLDAVEAYQKVVTLAPWIGDNYYNLGVAQEQAGKFQDAINSFELYLIASPDTGDAKEVRERIGGLKYAAEKAVKDSSPEAVAEKKQNAYGTWLKELDGARFISAPLAALGIGYETEHSFLVYEITGREVRIGWIDNVRNFDNYNFKTAPIRYVNFNDGRMSEKIENKKFTIPKPSFMEDQRPYTGVISDDGQFITQTSRGSEMPYTYTRVK